MIHKIKPRRCPSSSALSASGEPLRWRCPHSRTRAAEGARTPDGSLWLQDEEGQLACPRGAPSKVAAGSLPLPPPGNWTDWAVRSDRAHAQYCPAHRDVGSLLAHGPRRPRSSAETRYPAALIPGPLITASRRRGLGWSLAIPPWTSRWRHCLRSSCLPYISRLPGTGCGCGRSCWWNL